MRTILGWIAISMLCFLVLATAAHGQPVPTPCIPRDGCPPADEWYTYRYNNSRTGAQPWGSPLSDPLRVQTLKIKWQFPREGDPSVEGFKASPIVVNDTVFIGSLQGIFYALDAATGTLKWRYPPSGALVGSPELEVYRYGFESSASYWSRSPNGAVIFGAQDPSLPPFLREPPPDGRPPPPAGYGSARLFALDARTGQALGLSDRIAEASGKTECRTDELHERFAWSSPLVFDNKVYVGIHANFGDSPIQVGRVIAVDLATGHIDPTFRFQAVGTPGSPREVRGGGVWNAPATDGAGVYFTTGNVRGSFCPFENPKPNPNHGLSMIRVDKDTGRIIWEFQPVPYELDLDPDWAAGATVMSTSCGELIASVQKDGWSYAVDAASGSCRWQFPPVHPSIALPPACTWTGYSKFNPNVKPPVHGNDDYRRPGAAWNDVFIVRTGGESLAKDSVSVGYDKLHALNACATTE